MAITATKTTPTITWPTPAAITYGTALSGTQLNASASVGGSYSYSPPQGTVLNAGTQVLTVNFTPTDTTNYNNASTSVTLTVNKATPTITWATPASVPVGTALSGTQLNATASVPGTFVYSPSLGAVMSTAGNTTLSTTFTPTSTANYNNASTSVPLTVTAVTKTTPTITWPTPAAITYGTALSGTQLNASASVGGSYSYSPPQGTVLNAGTQVLTVNFTPTDTTNYNNASTSVTLTVNKATPTITWATPASVPVGTALSGTQLNATASVPGTFVYSPSLGAVMSTAGNTTLSTTFTPTDTTDYNTNIASVVLVVNPVTKTTPTITWATPATITYGTALSGTQLNASASVPGTFSYAPTLGTVLNSGTQVLSVTFTPTDTTNYNNASGSVTLTVNKATPAITWSTPAAITVGTALSGTQLNATASVPGTFVYSPTAGTVMSSTGNTTLSTTFTPTNTTNYNNASATVLLAVNPVTKTTPTITWNAPTAITYGTALSATQLNATASVGGSYSYSPQQGTVLTVGSQTLTVTFTPTDTTDYNTASKSVTLTVNTATPSITWNTPAAITYGTALSATQLNASSTVAGTFAYTPAAGTVLNVGSQTLSTTFTPSDNTDYNNASANVVLIVVNVIGAAATPTFSPLAGTYTSAQTVSISDATTGATIYYTTNGTTPTTSSPVYSGAITVSSTETLEAIATATGYSTSALATAAYTISISTNPIPAISSISPAFTNAGGTVFTLTVNGSGFIASSTAYWGISALTTTYVSASQLTAQVPAADIASVGTMSITVQTPAPGGGASNAWQFEVDSAASGTSEPTITSTSETIAAGSTASYPVTVPSSGTNISVSCLNRPAGATCSYSSTTNTVTIATSSTTPKGTYQIIVVFTETVTSSAFLLPFLLLPLGFLRRKSTGRGIWLTACLGLVLLATVALSIGCGTNPPGSTTPPATQQVTSSSAVSLTIQ